MLDQNANTTSRPLLQLNLPLIELRLLIYTKALASSNGLSDRLVQLPLEIDRNSLKLIRFDAHANYLANLQNDAAFKLCTEMQLLDVISF